MEMLLCLLLVTIVDIGRVFYLSVTAMTQFNLYKMFIKLSVHYPTSKGLLDQCRSDIVFYVGPISGYNIGWTSEVQLGYISDRHQFSISGGGWTDKGISAKLYTATIGLRSISAKIHQTRTFYLKLSFTIHQT